MEGNREEDAGVGGGGEEAGGEEMYNKRCCHAMGVYCSLHTIPCINVYKTKQSLMRGDS